MSEHLLSEKISFDIDLLELLVRADLPQPIASHDAQEVGALVCVIDTLSGYLFDARSKCCRRQWDLQLVESSLRVQQQMV